MCKDCGCSLPEQHHHEHGEGHGHHHHDHADDARVVDVRTSILSKNDRFAEQNRGVFRAMRLSVLNLVSSPGSGNRSRRTKSS